MNYHCKHCGPGKTVIPGGDVCFDCYTGGGAAGGLVNSMDGLFPFAALRAKNHDMARERDIARTELREAKADLDRLADTHAETLKAMVEDHVREMAALRQENEALRARVAEMEPVVRSMQSAKNAEVPHV